jgi:hypothetical protein
LVTKQDAIQIRVTEAEIKSVMQKAMAQFAIAKRDNLRNRHINIQYDCILRGYIGEYAMARWLDENDVYISTQNFKEDGDTMDIDFLYKGKNIELKTSLVPDVDATIANVIAKRDIKLIKRKATIEELEADIHLQIIFDQRRKAKDEWLQSQTIDIENTTIDILYKSILAKCYINTIYFVGWIDKQTLSDNINALSVDKRTWSFKNSQRDFWNCKISASKKPQELIGFLLEC